MVLQTKNACKKNFASFRRYFSRENCHITKTNPYTTPLVIIEKYIFKKSI
jgi:hypothetical protein